MYEIDLGYNFVEDCNEVLQFESLEEASKFANDVMRATGEVLCITENKEM